MSIKHTKSIADVLATRQYINSTYTGRLLIKDLSGSVAAIATYTQANCEYTGKNNELHKLTINDEWKQRSLKMHKFSECKHLILDQPDLQLVDLEFTTPLGENFVVKTVEAGKQFVNTTVTEQDGAKKEVFYNAHYTVPHMSTITYREFIATQVQLGMFESSDWARERHFEMADQIKKIADAK